MSKSILLPPLPTPYEYALISKESYSKKRPSLNSPISRRGWERIKFIEDNAGYCASIWINHHKKQIVIAHRGAQNLNSFIAYSHSIIRLKPGHFVGAAIDLLQHPTVAAYKVRHYRLSTTGHSLGGFLAQVCVYWAKRSDFKETFYPDMSAMVFDAPGVVDFLKLFNSSLEREKRRIRIEHLNIHNFCATPTIINTYGRHTGTIWHLSGNENNAFDFIYKHRMAAIFKGFDPKTGQPYHFRTMRDWPQADYSLYYSLGKTINHITSETIKLPFSFLNMIYKKLKQLMKYPETTWYDQLLANKGEFGQYLYNTRKIGRWPIPQNFNQKLMLAIDAFYTVTSFEPDTIKRIDIHHFDIAVQIFLLKLDAYQPWPEDFLKALKLHYGNDVRLLQSFQIRQEGKITEVELEKDYPYTILDFQINLQQLLHKKGILPIHKFKVNKKRLLHEHVIQLESELSTLKKISKQKHT